MLEKTALLTAACLAATPLLAQDSDTTGAENDPIAEAFGIEAGPPDFRDIQIDGLSAEALTGSEILDANQDRIGEVSDVLIVEDEADKIVMALDGVPAARARTLLIPLDKVQIQKDGETFRVRTTLTDDTIDRLAEYDAA